MLELVKSEERVEGEIKDSDTWEIHCIDCGTNHLVSGKELNSYRSNEYDCDVCDKVIEWDEIEEVGELR